MSLAFDLCDFLWSESCTLPLRLRSYLAVLALRAHWTTGEGKSGRQRIARCSGISVRQQSLLRRELESLTDSPVVVAWQERHLEGRRTSDRYTIGFARCELCGLNCKPGALNCKPGGAQLQGLQRISVTGSPTGGTYCNQVQTKEENNFQGERPLASPLIEKWAGPNALHEAQAAKLGVELAAAAASFRAYHTKCPGWAKSPKFRGFDLAFGGWLKRQGETAPKVLTPAELEAAEVAAWRARVAAGGT